MTNVVKLSKKAFTWSVVVMTVLWSVGAAALIPATVQAVECPTLEAGDLFKIESSSAVYLVNSDLKRMYFPTGEVYKTWYTDYSGVQTIDTSCTAAYPPAGGVNFRPGSRLFKTPISPVVYAVSPNNTKNAIADEATAAALYGANWASLVRDLGDVFILNYKNDGSEVKDSTPHNGQLVKKADSADVYLVVDGMLKKVEGDLSMAASGDVRTVSTETFAKLEMSEMMASAASVVANPSQMNGSTTETPATTGKLSVSLASDNPASKSVITAIDGVVFTKLALANGSSKDVTINSFKIERTGLGSTADFDSITLYSSGMKLGTTKTSPHSDGYWNYNVSGGFTVKAGETKMLEIHGKLGSAKTGTFNALGVSSVSLASGEVSGLPAYGNAMSGVKVTVGEVTLDANGTATQTKKVGDTDVTLAKFAIKLDDNENAKMHKMTLKLKNTASMSDVKNLALYQGSTKIAGPTSLNSDKEVMFVLDTVLPLLKGKTVDFKVLGDITNGVGNKIEFILENSADLVIIGDNFGSRITVTDGSSNDRLMNIASSGTTETTIAGAQVNVSFTSAALDTPNDRNDVEFGRFTISAGSTDVKISEMLFVVDETKGAGASDDVVNIDDLELVDESTGAAYSGTNNETTLNDDDKDVDVIWTYSDEIFLSAGESRTFIIRGDVPSDARSLDTYKVKMADTTTGITAETSPEGDVITDFSVTSLNGKLITIKEASLTVRVIDLNTVSAVKGTEGVVVYKGSLEAIGGDITVEGLRFEAAASGKFDKDNFTKLSFYTVDGTTETLQDSITGASITDAEADFDDMSFVVKKGSANKVNFVVKVDVDSEDLDATNKTLKISLDSVNLRDVDNDDAFAYPVGSSTKIADSAELATATTVDLKGTGILYVSMRTQDTGFNKKHYLLAGDTAWIGKLRLKAEYEDILLRDLRLTNSVTTADGSVKEVCLYKSTEATEANKVACSTLDTTGTVFFDDMNVNLTQGSHDWYIYVSSRNMGKLASETATTHDVLSFRVSTSTTDVVARGQSSGDDLVIGDFTGTVNNVAEGKIVFDADNDGLFGEALDISGTASTLNQGVVGSKISSVSLVSSYGGQKLSPVITGTGEYTVGIVEVVNAASSNKDSDGNELKLIMSSFRFDFTKNTKTVFDSVTVERIGGTVGAVTTTLSDINTSTKSSGYVTVAASTTAKLGVDAKIDEGSKAYFIVKANLSAVDGTTGAIDWVQMNLNTLDGSSSINNIDWYDGSGATALVDLYTGKSSIDGTKIVKQN